MTTTKITVGYDRSADARAAARWALDEAARTSARRVLLRLRMADMGTGGFTVPAPAVWPDGETDRAIKGMLHEAVRSAQQSHPGVRTEISISRGGRLDRQDPGRCFAYLKTAYALTQACAADEVLRNTELHAHVLLAGLWDHRRAEGLLRDDAPSPVSPRMIAP